MSRVGKLPISLPSGVTVTSTDSMVSVTGSQGTLKYQVLPGITVKQDGDQLIVSRSDDSAEQKARHGLTRALINNMVVGVSQGFSKKLEVNGVGYRANLVGTDLQLSLGFSHMITYKVPEGITIKAEQNVITVSGIDKQRVGQVAAEIRSFKKPEPYKGKGIKYEGERILRKSGKSGKDK